MTHRLGVLLGLAISGCSVAEVAAPPEAIAINECAASTNCGRGARCEDGACAATSSQLEDLLIEVTQPITFGSGGLPFYKQFAELPSRGERLDLELSPVATLTGRVLIDRMNGACPPDFAGPAVGEVLPTAADDSIPAEVIFTPSVRVLGIATQAYSARVDLAAASETTAGGGPPTTYTFNINLPPGDYDVYVKPRQAIRVTQDGKIEPDDKCASPPLLLVHQLVEQGGKLDVILPVPSKLKTTVRFPENTLNGWTVDLLDPLSGRVLSTQSVLPEPTISQPTSSIGFVTTAEIWYAPVYTRKEGGGIEPTASEGNEIVRLSPPIGYGTDRPAIFAARDATNAMGELRQTAVLPKDVIVDFLSLIAGETTPVEAAVTLTATSLDGFDPGVFAAYTRTVQVRPDGHYTVQVPPGTYRVDAVPKGASARCDEAEPGPLAPCLASAHTTWHIGEGPEFVQGGKVVEFSRAPLISGRALAATGAVVGAAVRATVSPFSVQSDLLDTVLGVAASVPRVSAALVNDDGYFAFFADPGTYDLFVQPDSGSRFGWYVQQSLVVDAAFDQDLRNLSVPMPVVYRGQVTMTAGQDGAIAVPGALIRAYTSVPNPDALDKNPDGSDKKAVMQVAEARADSNGAFELLIPARVNLAESAP